MKKRDFLSLADLSKDESRHVLDLAQTMKDERKTEAAARIEMFRGKSVALVMEKASTRTRISFEVGAAHLGMHAVVLTAQGSQLARGESITDTGRQLSRWVELIVFRTSAHARLIEMATSSRVPVINGLTDDAHPMQVLCDVFTIEEHFARSIEGMRVAWIGDGGSNMARSFIEASKIFGFELRVGGPAAYFARDHGGARFTTDAREALEGADVVCTDVWTSMGQEDENEIRLREFSGWTVDASLLAHAKPTAIVMHCLPAHRGEEIDAATIEGPRSLVWEQSENRLHVQKALMAFLLGAR